MSDRPFTQRIAEAAPVLWANYLRAVERERREGELRLMLEQYGRPVRLEIVDEESEMREIAA